jgi:hypothetical protein
MTHVDSPTWTFIIGTGRCGSTILEEALVRHPDVGFISNVDSYAASLNPKGRWNNALYRSVPTRFRQRDRIRSGKTRQSSLHFGPSEAWKLMSARVSPLWSEPVRDLTADDVTPWLERRFRQFFEERASAQKKPAFLHKYTGWPRAGFVHRILPDARFIHFVRDGRAVAASLMQRPWWRGYLGPPQWGFGLLPKPYAAAWERHGRSFVVLAGLEWMVLMDAFEAARKAVPSSQWLQVRYEDYVDAPRETVEKILASMGLDWNDDFELAFGTLPMSKARLDGFKRELTAAHLAALDDVLGPHLSRLGYG